MPAERSQQRRHPLGRLLRGVIHSGVYYAPGSRNAALCVGGARELYAYCERRGIPVERCGKVIVATERAELDRLRALHERARANGVEGAALVGPAELAALEPHVRGVAALWIPGTGITDFVAVARELAADVRAGGGGVLLGRAVVSVASGPGQVRLATSGGSLRARHVIACAGLQADRVARLSGAPRQPAIIPFRGSYWTLAPQRRGLIRNLVYPVPDPAFPFLGVHFTRRIDGAVWVGPNAVPATAREGYRRRDVRVRDVLETVGHPGARRLARAYWRTGAQELARDLSAELLGRSLRRYVPEVANEDLVAGPSGVRAQAVDADGRMLDDFAIDAGAPAVIHVRNAPSPAATSSLAIGDVLAEMVVGRLDGRPRARG